MKSIYRNVIWSLVFLVATIVVSITAYIHWHTMILEQYDTIRFEAGAISRGGSTVVRITGFEGHSAYSIKKVSQERDGSSIVVLVYLFIARPPDTRELNIDIAVPESVNEIRFGKRRTLVWKRGQATEISPYTGAKLKGIYQQINRRETNSPFLPCFSVLSRSNSE